MSSQIVILRNWPSKYPFSIWLPECSKQIQPYYSNGLSNLVQEILTLVFLEGLWAGFRGITITHNKWNESFGRCALFGQGDNNFNQIFKITLGSKKFKKYHFYRLSITCKMGYGFLTNSFESLYHTTLNCLYKFFFDFIFH